MAFAIHQYFDQHGFFYLHTPLITASDCEGAGEMFRVTTLDPKNPPLTEEGEVDFRQDFFGKATNLTDNWKESLELWLWEKSILSDPLSGLKIQIRPGICRNSG